MNGEGKKDLMEHVYNAIQLYLSNEVPRKVVEYTTTARLWKKLRTFNMTKSLTT